MSDLVGNPEDQFSHNEAHFGPGGVCGISRSRCWNQSLMSKSEVRVMFEGERIFVFQYLGLNLM